jgi:CRP-like cAMP-binding protein
MGLMVKTRTAIAGRLSALGLFIGLGREELAHFASGATEIPAPRGTILLREGDACTGLHVVLTGQVKLSLLTARGQERVFRLVGEGESFGEPALFLDQRHLMTAEAITDTTLLHVPKELIVRAVSTNAVFARRLIDELCRQLHDRTLDLQSYLVLSGRQRVVGYLLNRLPAGVNGVPVSIMLPAKKGIIASRLNLTQEHFSRILHELAAAQLIEVKGRTVRIPDVHRLAAHRSV